MPANENWPAFHSDLAYKIRDFEHNQPYLVKLLQEAGVEKGLMDKEEGKEFILEEIDPFTFMSLIAKHGDKRRHEILKHLKKELKIDREVPEKFSGMPSSNARNAWYFRFKDKRKDSDIKLLWKLFKQSLINDIKDETFQSVLDLPKIGKAKLTHGLFWYSPSKYFPVDGQTRPFLERNRLPSTFVNLEEYLKLTERVSNYSSKTFTALSKRAYEENKEIKSKVERKKKLKEEESKRYWTYAPGPNGEKWEDFYRESVVAINWDEIGNLKDYQSIGEIRKALKDNNEGAGAFMKVSKTCFQFANEMQQGDVVYAKRGRNYYLGKGIVTSDYIFGDDREEYKSYRKIDWVKKGEWPATEHKIALKTLTEITGDISLIQKVEGILEGQYEFENRKLNRKFELGHNSILFGPPGTGKTYHTKDLSVRIIENLDRDGLNEEYGERQELLDRYEELCRDGRIEFVTFHQSFSYEDFVEGIKPKTLGGKISYNVKDGIFKRISKSAKEAILQAYEEDESREYNPVSYDSLYDAFIEMLENNPGQTLKTITSKEVSVKEVTSRKTIVLKPMNAIRSYGVSKTRLKKIYDRFESVDSIKNMHDDIVDTIGGASATYYWAVFNAFKEFEEGYKKEAEGDELQIDTSDVDLVDWALVPRKYADQADRFVLIIDEINRGNVAGIFGELITLIEEDKRLYGDEQMVVQLPYSKKAFSVPPNLYIIGTMNTADRSVEALDSALRRRFTFLPVYPKPHLDELVELKNLFDDELDLSKLLSAINGRIEKLRDRDHTIGHSYFLGLEKSDDPLKGLRGVFNNKLIPLLQEYFYGDYGKIGMILGKEFVTVKDDNATNVALKTDGDWESLDDFEERRVYQFTDAEDWDYEAFRSIYE